MNIDEHKLLTIWAAEFPDHVLPFAPARSAGHAAATAHVPDHARHAASYAIRASINKKAERDWQIQNLPDILKSIILLNEN